MRKMLNILKEYNIKRKYIYYFLLFIWDKNVFYTCIICSWKLALKFPISRQDQKFSEHPLNKDLIFIQNVSLMRILAFFPSLKSGPKTRICTKIYSKFWQNSEKDTPVGLLSYHKQYPQNILLQKLGI